MLCERPPTDFAFTLARHWAYDHPCPYCGSDETEREGLFGPTPCRDARYCRACQQPFEAFRS